MAKCDKCGGAVHVELDHQEARCVQCGKRWYSHLQPQPKVPRSIQAPRNIATTPSLSEKIAASIAKRTSRPNKAIYLADRALKEMGAPFFKDHSIRIGEEVLVTREPFFDAPERPAKTIDQKRRRALRKTWADWRRNREKIAREILTLPKRQQELVQGILRLRGEQSRLYGERVRHRIKRLQKGVNNERAIINTLKATLSKDSLFAEDLTKAVDRHIKTVEAKLADAEKAMMRAEGLLVDVTQYGKKSPARAAIRSELLHVLVSAGMSKRKASILEQRIWNLADPRKPMKSSRYLP